VAPEMSTLDRVSSLAVCTHYLTQGSLLGLATMHRARLVCEARIDRVSTVEARRGTGPPAMKSKVLGAWYGRRRASRTVSRRAYIHGHEKGLFQGIADAVIIDINIDRHTRETGARGWGWGALLWHSLCGSTVRTGTITAHLPVDCGLSILSAIDPIFFSRAPKPASSSSASLHRQSC
jgi:hypothetical protein